MRIGVLFLAYILLVAIPSARAESSAKAWDVVMAKKEHAKVWRDIERIATGSVKTDASKIAEIEKGLLQIAPANPVVGNLDLEVAILRLLSIAENPKADKGLYLKIIKILDRVIERYPKRSIMAWNGSARLGIGAACLQRPWWIGTRGMVFWNSKDDTIRLSRSFDHENLSTDQRMIVEYFKHLSVHPNYVREVVPLAQSELYVRCGDMDKAIEVLEKLVESSRTRFEATMKVQLKLPYDLKNTFIRSTSRPTAMALGVLASHYAQKGKKRKAISTMGYLVATASPKGEISWANEYLSKLYKEELGKDHRKTVEQYTVVLEACKRDMKLQVKRNHEIGGGPKDFSTQPWIRKIASLQKSLGIEVDAEKIVRRSLDEQYAKDDKVNSDSFEAKVLAIYEKRGKLKDPEERIKAVNTLVEDFNRAFEKGSGKAHLSAMGKERVSLFTSLIEIASTEEAQGVKKACVEAAGRLVRFEPLAHGNVDQVIEKLEEYLQEKGKSGLKKEAQKYLNSDKTPFRELDYAIRQCGNDDHSLEVRRAIILAISTKPSPWMFPSFKAIVEKTEDATMARAAARALRHIVTKYKPNAYGKFTEHTMGKPKE